MGQRNLQKLKFNFICSEKNHLKVTLKQKKVGSFGKSIDILIYCWLKNMKLKSNYSASKVVHVN